MLLFLDPWELTKKIQRPFLEGAVTVYRVTPRLLADEGAWKDPHMAKEV